MSESQNTPLQPGEISTPAPGGGTDRGLPTGTSGLRPAPEGPGPGRAATGTSGLTSSESAG